MSGKQAALFALFMVVLIILCFTVIFPLIAKKYSPAQKTDERPIQTGTAGKSPDQNPPSTSEKYPQAQTVDKGAIQNGSTAESQDQNAPLTAEKHPQAQKTDSGAIRNDTMLQSPKAPNRYAPSAASSRP